MDLVAAAMEVVGMEVAGLEAVELVVATAAEGSEAGVRVQEERGAEVRVAVGRVEADMLEAVEVMKEAASVGAAGLVVRLAG